MTRSSPPSAAPEAWASFWSDSGLVHAGAVHGERHAANLRSFWEGAFDARLSHQDGRRLLDLACGAGVVARTAIACASRRDIDLEVHCSDYAQPALAELSRLELGQPVMAVAGDAAGLPYADSTFDLVCSQYGIEYAGKGSFSEAARIASGRGCFLAVIHKAGGAIQQECQGNLELLARLEASALLRHFRHYIKISGRVAAGKAAPKALDRPMKAVAAASGQVAESVMSARPGAARDHVQRLLDDMRRLDQRRKQYNEDDIHRWIEGHAADLQAFRSRMETMVAAALDAHGVADAVEQLRQGGLPDVAIGDLMTDAGDASTGWTVRAAAESS